MRLGLSLVVVLYGLWLLWSGHFYDPLLLSLGAGSCLFVMLLCMRMDITDIEGNPFPFIAERLLLYLPWLMWELVKANIDVTRRILSPKMPLSPMMFEVEAFQKSELGQTIYANSITLTPGTVSVEMQDGKIVVHAISRDVAQGLIDSDMDKRAAILAKRAAAQLDGER